MNESAREAFLNERGQSFLKETIRALDALEKKELIEGAFKCDEGVCALGAVARFRGILLNNSLDEACCMLDIEPSIAEEIADENDEGGPSREEGEPSRESPEQRFVRMREWVAGQILK